MKRLSEKARVKRDKRNAKHGRKNQKRSLKRRTTKAA